MLVGHDVVREELERELPPVTLLIGPPSVGKGTLAVHLARHHHCMWAYYTQPSAAIAREVVTRVPLVLQAGGLKLVIIRLDGTTETVQNIMLKVLEEPPAHVRFILVASRPPLPTVVSRSVVYRLGLLSDEQVAEILQTACGMSPAAAAAAAPFGRGSVAPALREAADDKDTRTRSVVAAAVRAARDGDPASLDLALRSWSPDHAAVLQAWAQEAASGRWNQYAEAFAPGVTKPQARKVVKALVQYSGARNAAAVALANAFSKGSK